MLDHEEARENTALSVCSSDIHELLSAVRVEGACYHEAGLLLGTDDLCRWTCVREWYYAVATIC